MTATFTALFTLMVAKPIGSALVQGKLITYILCEQMVLAIIIRTILKRLQQPRGIIRTLNQVPTQ